MVKKYPQSERDNLILKLKFNGLSNDKISAEVGLAEDTIRLLFRPKGRLRPKYDEFNANVFENILKDISGEMATYAKEALLTEVEIMRKGTNEIARLSACQDIMNRTMGKPIERQMVYGQHQHTIAGWVAAKQGYPVSKMVATKPHAPIQEPLG